MNYYDTPDFDAWGWDTSWDCAQWQLWHELMVNAYGPDMATDIWCRWWFSQANGTGYGFGSTDWCGYDSEFVRYFAKYGVDVGSTLTNALIVVEDAAATAFAWAPWVLGLVGLGVVAYYGIDAYSKYRTFSTVRKVARNLSERK